jgi:hypothetical protein
MLNPQNTPRWGSDPEGFFSRAGQIIGSEKLIPENGISTYTGKIVRDGVQFELNPVSGTIEELGRNIGGLFNTLQSRLKRNPGVSVVFDGLVEVSQQELDSLSPVTRILGCNPSYNAYEDKPINVDPVTYRKRSSGGHIHVGTTDKKYMQERRMAVPVYDILVGNTCVLFDRDPGAAERRENYGRAGEFRLPDHGLEYRTTSNFWLRDYTLMHLVFGLAHIAYELTYQSFNGNTALWQGLAQKVNITRIQQAIDQNDYDLALKNFKRLVPFLRKNLPADGFVLTPKNIDKVIQLSAKPITELFPTDQIIPNWMQGNRTTFNDFVERL